MMQNINQGLYSRASYGVSIATIVKKIDRIITAPHCTTFFFTLFQPHVATGSEQRAHCQVRPDATCGTPEPCPRQHVEWADDEDADGARPASTSDERWHVLVVRQRTVASREGTRYGSGKPGADSIQANSAHWWHCHTGICHPEVFPEEGRSADSNVPLHHERSFEYHYGNKSTSGDTEKQDFVIEKPHRGRIADQISEDSDYWCE